MIVTKTDLLGRITYANNVFCRIAAHPEAELLGAPHSIIRHPEMPRAVFKLLWDTLKARQEIFAYVLNLAGDGAHYWVFAHVTPTLGADGSVIGYHSTRRLPDPRVVRQIQPIYQALLAEESHHARAIDAAQAGFDLMVAVLAEQRVGYDEFVWSLTNGVDG